MDAIDGVRLLQVNGRYILGGVDLNVRQNFGTDIREVNSYFVLDTVTGKRTTFPNFEALRTAALQIGIQPNLEPVDTVYLKSRFSWFDVFTGLLFLVPSIVAFGFLIRWIIQLRHTRPPIPQPA